jgi:hypothetical protein
MYTQLKGMLFNRSGTSYLILNGDGDAAEWFWVRTVNPSRQLLRMHRDDILSCLPELQTSGASYDRRAHG